MGLQIKTLSKELKILESNQLLRRTVQETVVPGVSYELTSHGRSLATLLEELQRWGQFHRNKIMRD